jgi:hypothetical protein
LRKLIAILLLSVHLFNLYGYNLLNRYFMYRSDKDMNEHIAKNMYKVQDLVMVKLPVNMPGIQSWSDFENISGQIQFKKACYNYVKLKLTKNAIYVMCIPNYEKTRLTNDNIINVRQIDDLPGAKGNTTMLKKPSIDKFNLAVLVFEVKTQILAINTHYPITEVNPKGCFKETPYRPPDTTGC